MRDNNRVEQRTTNGMHPIDRYVPPDWRPEYIVYAKVGFAIDDGALTFSIKEGPYRKREGILDDMLELVSRGNPDPTIDNWTIPGAPVLPLKPLDLDIRRPSQVILELEKGWNWQFRTGGPAVTAKEDIPGGNAGLRHVTFDGNHKPKADYRPPTANGCRVVYFSVLQRMDADMHGMNLHVEFIQAGPHAIEVIIDPDVGNNGGSIYPPR